MKLLNHLRQHLALEECGETEMPVLKIDALEEERMVDIQDWLAGGGGLKDVDECIAAVRRQAAAEVRWIQMIAIAFERKRVPRRPR